MALHVAIARYREQAVALQARLVALEAAGNENVAPLREALRTSTERLEELARLVEAPPPAPVVADPYDWLDAPTVRLRRKR